MPLLFPQASAPNLDITGRVLLETLLTCLLRTDHCQGDKLYFLFPEIAVTVLISDFVFFH